MFRSPRRIDWYATWPIWVTTWPQVTLIWSNFDLDFPRSAYIYFDASRREEHDGIRIISLAFLAQKLLAKKHFCPLTIDDDLWWPQYRPERKMDWNGFEMIDELSNAFSRFSLPRLGAELDRGEGRLDASPLPTTQVSEHRPGAGLKLFSPSSVMAHSILVMGVFVTMRGPPKS